MAIRLWCDVDHAGKPIRAPHSTVVAGLLAWQPVIGRNGVSVRPQQMKWKGEEKSGWSPRPPLVHVLTFCTAIGDRNEQNDGQTRPRSFVSFHSAVCHRKERGMSDRC